MSPTDLVAVVLCGGASSRMGTDKAALPHPDGGRFLGHALERIRGLADTRAIAGRDKIPWEWLSGDDAPDRRGPTTEGPLAEGPLAEGPLAQGPLAQGPLAEGPAIIPLPDPRPLQGPLSGVLESLRFAAARNRSAVLVTPVDMPYLTRGDLIRLLETYARRPGRPAVATFDPEAPLPRPEPLVAVYPVDCLRRLERLERSPRRSLSGWLATEPHSLCGLPRTSAANVNHPSDLTS